MQNAKTAANALSDGDETTPPSAAEQAALDALATATSAHALTLADLEAARVVRDAALEPFGLTMDGDNVQITNVSPDVGLSAPFNSWFTLFGQFFDHGLDLVNKGGSGTVFVPLQPDDPLYVPGSPTNFMVLTRATVSRRRRRRHAARRTTCARSTPRLRSSTRTRPIPRTPPIRCSCASMRSTPTASRTPPAS